MAAKNKTTKTETIKPSIEEMVLGEKEETKTYEVFDYLSRDVKYNVKINSNGRTIEVNGREVGTFLGQNAHARKLLEKGEKKVNVCDNKGNELYIIEVI